MGERREDGRDEDRRDGVPVMVNRAGVSDMLGVTTSMVSKWAMPAPDGWVRGRGGALTPVWEPSTVREWDRTRDRKPGPKRGRA